MRPMLNLLRSFGTTACRQAPMARFDLARRSLTIKSGDLEIDKYATAIASGNRFMLSKAITLIESTRDDLRTKGQQILDRLLELQAQKRKGQGFRLGISGPPGVGKSTFIEALGMEWINAGHKVAVVAVDPSSHLSGGSILGDKTRMERLSMNPNAYVRPCASGCVLGGLAQHTDEVVMLMEAAGYNMVLVETVGVGQSEVLVTEVADMCLLLLPPAGGDELQGIKRGIVEAADLVVVNKADGDLLMPAKRALVEYRSALHTARGGGRAQRPWWEGSAMLCSSVDGTGVANVAKEALKFKQTGEQAGELLKRRGDQRTTWMWRKAEQDLIEAFRAHAKVKTLGAKLESEVRAGYKSSRFASKALISEYLQAQK
eukprot:CAMPEP_0113705246 /NCGR_PEP_ID=MMETSP0038_2-20120614/27022_1 /TAXON_ID=2898 /ORGANISM="Cryptomonas paramecium" /LENGTH=372 /DNA_ID=CAMNT_0000630225 /DNA_START=11 /DNA_END=1129 /DNA_ORIENTATION=+ /assembly_acc=CAM_ASM_000170